MSLKFDLERDELADRLGGSLPTGALALIEGGSGSGKSVLAQRLAYGLLKQKHNVVYVSTEFTTAAFLHQMEQLGYPSMDAFTDRNLKFASTHPLMGHPVPSEELLPRLLGARRLITEDVVIIDVFSQLTEPHLAPGKHGSRVLEHLARTLKKINATGTTLICCLDPRHLEGIDTSPLTSSADVRLECATERVGGAVDRFVVPKKFARASGQVGDVIPFRVEPGAGFIVEIKAVA